MKAPAYRYVFVEPEGTWGFISLIDGVDLWRLSIAGRDQQQLNEMDVSHLIRRAIGRDIPFSIEAKSFWIRKRTVADRFRDGRVFIAGDAAHAHPPRPQRAGVLTPCWLGRSPAWMPKACSNDLRERVVKAVKAGQSCRSAALRFGISPSSAIKWMER
jgi:hypothetical protein